MDIYVYAGIETECTLLRSFQCVPGNTQHFNVIAIYLDKIDFNTFIYF